jgi:ActR/RegA family two-component response regulator
VVDFLMPEKEGLETIPELRQDILDTKIIAICGGGRVGAHYYFEIAKKMGASVCLKSHLS